MFKNSYKPFALFFKSLIFVFGLLLFAGFVHRTIPVFLISLVGLLISVVVIVRDVHSFRDFSHLFGFKGNSNTTIYYLPLGILIGLIFGFVYRKYLNLNIIPAQLTGFAFIAVTIGSTEEALFRGYFQTNIRKINVLLSIVLATTAHTVYKYLIFLPYIHQPDININFIVIWTFMGGLVFALLKEFSESTIFPVISHAFFDLLVYGDSFNTPWWIWS